MQVTDHIGENPATGKGKNKSNGSSNGHGSNGSVREEERARLPLTDEVKFGMEGLTFDDVLLVPAYSEVLPTPDYISTATLFTPTIPLNIPIASAAMDTVTEGRM